METKAITGKRKPRRKSEIPYRLKSAIDNHTAGQHREETAFNESATEQTQQAVVEVVHRATQVPPQIRYAIHKHRQEGAKEKQREQEQVYTEQQDTPAPVQEQAKLEAQKQAAQTDTAMPVESVSPSLPDIFSPRAYSPSQTEPPKAAGTSQIPSVSSRPQSARRTGESTGSIQKGQTVDRAAPKQKPQAIPKTKQVMEKQAAAKHIRPEKTAPVKVEKTIAQRTAELGQRRFKRNAQKQALQQTQKAAKTTGAVLKTVGIAIGHAAKAVIGWLIGLVGGAGLAVIFCLVLLVAAVAASPFGIFFANEPSANTIPLSSAVGQITMELNTRLMELQDGEYESIEIHGAPPEWPEVITVFAAHIAGEENGMDVALLDDARVDLLRSTFWDMCSITSEVETEEPEETLHITISAKTAEEMRTVYGFTDFQNEALDMLLAEEGNIRELVGDLGISQADALALLSNLPDDLSPERRAVVQQALMLVGKVNYFWGGKSLVLGWDSRWGQLTKVSAAGSPTTGTYRPYGLDCSGFADWVFYNASGGGYIIGHGGGAATQHRYCTNISWANAQPGDLAFYPDDSHVGIVGGWDEDGNVLIIHCASGRNNVVITGKSGFTSVARPLYYGE